MNNTNIKVHRYQKAILLKLAVSSGKMRFNRLLVKGLESEHMNYHLKQLLLLGLVEKADDGYRLTDSGKDYVNLVDSEVDMIEKQPKTSIIVRAVRRNRETGEFEHLLCKRLRQPYYGKVGRITGKVRFGETFEEAASRELVEETGLVAGKFTLEEIYRKMRRREDGIFVQDVIFYRFFAAELDGELIHKTETQENFWATKGFVSENCDVYDDLELEDLPKPRPLKYRCSVDIADGF